MALQAGPGALTSWPCGRTATLARAARRNRARGHCRNDDTPQPPHWTASVKASRPLSQHWLRLRPSRTARRRIAHYNSATPRPPWGHVTRPGARSIASASDRIGGSRGHARAMRLDAIAGKPQAGTAKPEPASGRAPPPVIGGEGAGRAPRRLPYRSPPTAAGCTTSPGRRTWWPRPASRRSPPGGTSPRPPSRLSAWRRVVPMRYDPRA